MSQKPPVNLAIWQWALIGSGATLVLSLVVYVVFNLISSPKSSAVTSSNSTPLNNVSTSNPVSTASNNSVIITQVNVNDSISSIAGTWLVEPIGRNAYNESIQVVITNDGRVIVPDPTNSSRLIEGPKVIRKISSTNNLLSGNIINSMRGTWLIEGMNRTPTNEPIQVIITNDGLVSALDPAKSYKPERIAKLIRKISDSTTPPSQNIIKLEDFGRERMAINISRAKQSEPRTYVGIMNRKQGDFYLEKVRFATSLNELGVDISSETQNYSYYISVRNDANQVRSIAFQFSQAKYPNLKSYVGAVRFTKIRGAISILCETNRATTLKPATPVLVGDDKLECATGTSQK
jgi:hypothetical protein